MFFLNLSLVEFLVLFGSISADCPGSLIQEHSSVEVTMTETAAAAPLLNVAQDTGE